MNLGVSVLLTSLACSVSASSWRWPDSGPARIDSKLGFIDHDHNKLFSRVHNQEAVQDDDLPFLQPKETIGFYNQPSDVGRYPVQVQHNNKLTRHSAPAGLQLSNRLHKQDGTLDSLQYCKCVNTPECGPRPNSEAACGKGRYLCCYRQRPIKSNTQNSEYFNELEDERPQLFPGQQNLARPFPPPSPYDIKGYSGPFGPNHENTIVNTFEKHQQGVLVGPGGPTGVIGPQAETNVLVGPGGPTGVIGPLKNDPTRRVGRYHNPPLATILTHFLRHCS